MRAEINKIETRKTKTNKTEFVFSKNKQNPQSLSRLRKNKTQINKIRN